ncbi:hypothetical protein B566_EDAN012702 [Ephemera danica]|nr:hypothetical protein B566_EDAN012702 [Ephemera danica]
MDNCGDGSDENNMTLCASRAKPCNLYAEYQCANRKCIDKARVCDFADDCGDASDELGCHHSKTCSEATRGGCEHHCMNLTDGGYICACYSGFIISADNRKKCEDVDECATFDSKCSQLCTNLNGSFSCECRPGFELSDSGVCRASISGLALLLANGPEIRALDPRNRRGEDVIRGEKRVEAIDFNPHSEMIFWADSFDKSIKRSFMVGAKAGEVHMGFAQDLSIKGTGKPSALAVDWLSDNVYWAEFDRTGPKPKGRILVAKGDGRYKRSLITSGLESPSAIALDPIRGKMFWADAGSTPHIEVSWMDGSKRRTIISEGLRHPTALVVDTALGHPAIFWADAKMNTIEVARQDGSKRTVVLRGESLKHPISLDVFESDLYWATRDSGELVKQDKFGRGVPVILAKDLVNPSAVKVYHQQRYNLSTSDRCHGSPCSHLCLLVPGANERPRPLPRVCPCQNGGVCMESDTGSTLTCECPADFQGNYCADHVARTKVPGAEETSRSAAILISVLVILLIAAAVGAAYFIFRYRPFGKGSVLGSSQSVSFRHGTNVEFGSPTFTTPPTTVPPEPMDAEYDMGELGGKTRNFSNPMYDALDGAGTSPTVGPTGIYEVPAEVLAAASKKVEPPSAVVAPLASLREKQNSKASPPIKRRELDPAPRLVVV